MIYSVYNYATRKYDYYTAPTKATPHAPAPPRALGVGELGATPDEAAWPLPIGAKRVGVGINPKGRIATAKGPIEAIHGALSGTLDTSTNVIAMGAAAYLVWRFFLKKG